MVAAPQSSPDAALAEAEGPASSHRALAARPARVFAPASVGNFAAGFDSLGAALEPLDGTPWGDVVEVAPAPRIRLEVSGAFASHLPADPAQNLVLRTYALYSSALAAHGLEAPPLAFRLEKNLPVASGLGSSASSVAATLAACQASLGQPLARAELFTVAGEAEALVSGSFHLDNVVPSLVGGLQLMVPGADGRHDPRALPWFREMVIIVVTPELELETSVARQILPRELPMAEAIAFAQNLSGFVYALEARDREVFRRCLRDLLAEPYRAHLVPGFRPVQRAALAAGALGCTLSGAGPAVFAVAPSPADAERVGLAMTRAFDQAGVPARHRLCRLAHAGAREI